MVSVDISLYYQIIAFLFLIWILNMVLYKPVREVIARRRKKFLKLVSDVESCEQAVVDKENSYSVGIKNARVLGRKRKETVLENAFSEESELIGKVNKKVQLELEDNRNKIRKEINNVRSALEADIGIFVKAIGQKILGRRL